MANYRWRDRPDIVARLVDTGTIKGWKSVDLVLKPNEAVTIISDGKIQDTLSETVLKGYAGGWSRWLGGKLGFGGADHKLLFTMTGPFDLMFLLQGQLADGSKVNGMANLRMQFNREDTPKLLNVFANSPRVIDRGFLVKMFQNELDERVTRSLLARFQDGMALRSPEFQESFEMASRAEMRASLGLIGITLLKGFCTVNETDVERLAAYTSRINTAQAHEQVDADAAMGQLERARSASLARIEMEADIATAKARGQVATELEHELKNLRKHEASLQVERDHEAGMSDIRVTEQDAKMQTAMAAFEVVQQKKQERMRLQAELNTDRQAQTDDMQKEMLEMAAEHSALTPDVMLEFLKQQTKQKEADK
jgi:hypothetical protein